MLEGVPRRLSRLREDARGRIALWALAAGAVALDLTTLRESSQDRLVIVCALCLFSLLIYSGIRLLIGRAMAQDRMHDAVVQLSGFLVLFLGTIAAVALVRALTDRAFAASMALLHGSWALGAIDGYRRGMQAAPRRSLEGSSEGHDP